MVRLLAFFLAAAAFWETKPPQQWTGDQLLYMMTESPWVQAGKSGLNSQWETGLVMYLASAKPMRDAEAEMHRRTAATDDFLFEDYRAWLAENADKYIVLAVRIAKEEALANAEDAALMEKDSKMIVSGRKYPVKFFFAASKKDPWARLAFPRAVTDKNKQVEFEVFVPLVSGNYRLAIFDIKTLMSNGKLEI